MNKDKYIPPQTTEYLGYPKYRHLAKKYNPS